MGKIDINVKATISGDMVQIEFPPLPMPIARAVLSALADACGDDDPTVIVPPELKAAWDRHLARRHRGMATSDSDFDAD